MSQPIVTISGQRVYPHGQAPERKTAQEPRGGRSASPHEGTLTEMSPNGWASGGNEETFEAGLPFLGALVAVIIVTIVALLIAKRGR